MANLTLTHYLLIAGGIIVLYFIFAYNGFITLRNNTEEAASDIEVQMKRRYDLIPNLIETVKGYAKHEKETLDAVVKARNAAMNNQGDLADKAEDENILKGALKSIFALSESYPDLKANENFLELQQELADTENKLQASRRFFNANVRAINIAVDHFPKNIIAKMFGFKKQEFFELDEGEKVAAAKPVSVKF